MARPDLTPAADGDGDGYGARDRALVLDLRSEQHSKCRNDLSDSHPAWQIVPRDFDAAQRALVASGLLRYDPRRPSQTVVTSAGLAAHAAAQRALADLAAGVAAAV